MPIPDNITREHIFQAMLKIKREGVPAKRGAREWALQYEGEDYPCKLLISWGNLYINGVELNPDPNNFTTYMAQDYLRALDFEVVAV
ncbi:hypothetical protein [Mucilaginibacter ginsenosidivorax]|uniref:Uncharacterized protein n=1 Tax=Mucilaginibacter ginsenosidivorax TaxID=862126 RepID=A0A5B8W840_9SPHI|nr:hypothetical protein [Mucilaginibacter ginsenosidivorax]QEC79709.1 hypothetical protein FSB76_28535 [Mucilaginibacter ginsenosidivorax]